MRNLRKIKTLFIQLLNLSGINLKEFLTLPIYLPRYIFQLYEYKNLAKKLTINEKKYFIPNSYPYLRLKDYKYSSGSASGHYFNQDLLVANLIFKTSPEIHLDIGGRMDGLIAHLLSFNQKVTMADVRKSEYEHPNLESLIIDLTNAESVLEIKNKYQSVSCLHTIEHFGLGRYGDNLDPIGHFNGLKNICSLIAISGTLYLSHPTGRSRTEFNGHRIINTKDMIYIFKELQLKPESLYLINDKGDLLPDIINSDFSRIDTKNYEYGLAIWKLKKL